VKTGLLGPGVVGGGLARVIVEIGTFLRVEH
jgi:hypothetical protein